MKAFLCRGFNIKAVCLTPEEVQASSPGLCLTECSFLLCRQPCTPLMSLGLIAHTKIRCLRDFQTEVSLLFMSNHEAAWSRKAGCPHAWLVSIDIGSHKPPLSLTPHNNLPREGVAWARKELCHDRKASTSRYTDGGPKVVHSTGSACVQI